jgi:chromosome segregation ATPase
MLTLAIFSKLSGLLTTKKKTKGEEDDFSELEEKIEDKQDAFSELNKQLAKTEPDIEQNKKRNKIC